MATMKTSANSENKISYNGLVLRRWWWCQTWGSLWGRHSHIKACHGFHPLHWRRRWWKIQSRWHRGKVRLFITGSLGKVEWNLVNGTQKKGVQSGQVLFDFFISTKNLIGSMASLPDSDLFNLFFSGLLVVNPDLSLLDSVASFLDFLEDDVPLDAVVETSKASFLFNAEFFSFSSFFSTFLSFSSVDPSLDPFFSFSSFFSTFLSFSSVDPFLDLELFSFSGSFFSTFSSLASFDPSLDLATYRCLWVEPEACSTFLTSSALSLLSFGFPISPPGKDGVLLSGGWLVSKKVNM